MRVSSVVASGPRPWLTFFLAVTSVAFTAVVGQYRPSLGSLERSRDPFQASLYRFEKRVCMAGKRLDPLLGERQYSKVTDPDTVLKLGGSFGHIRELDVMAQNSTYLIYFRMETYHKPSKRLSPVPTVNLLVNRVPNPRFQLYNHTWAVQVRHGKKRKLTKDDLMKAVSENQDKVTDWKLIDLAVDRILQEQEEMEDAIQAHPCRKVWLDLPPDLAEEGNADALIRGPAPVFEVPGPNPKKKYFAGFACYRAVRKDILLEIEASFINGKNNCVMAWKNLRVKVWLPDSDFEVKEKKRGKVIQQEDGFFFGHGPTLTCVKLTTLMVFSLFLCLFLHWLMKRWRRRR